NKLKVVLLLACLLTAFAVNVQAQNNKRGWQLELKKASLDLSSTDVKNAEDYKDFPNAKLTSDSQTLVKGHLHLSGDYFARNFVWGNEVLLDYGKTTLKPVDGEKTTNETSDSILFTSSYTHRLWQAENALGGFEAGPFGSLSYQTEFNSQGDSPLKKVLRAAVGVKIFEGKYIKNFHVAGFAEDDFTYDPSSENYGWEALLRIEHPIRDGVKGVYSGMFRNYLYRSREEMTDIDYEASLDARLDVAVMKEISIAPFIQYYTAQARAFGKRGQNLQIGISFGFSHTFIKAKEVNE
ncbi:MAG: hypothetical protein IKC13_05420, partial [Elusimicrobiaceae bacterium]|nr:hypothetical protein [Elusimicrobiaceae bacterium]